MRIWIVLGVIDYEGQDVLNVCGSEELAQLKLNQYRKNKEEDHPSQNWYYDKYCVESYTVEGLISRGAPCMCTSSSEETSLATTY